MSNRLSGTHPKIGIDDLDRDAPDEAAEGGKVERFEGEFAHDYLADVHAFLKTHPEREVINAALEQRFSEVAFFRDFLDHKKKAQVRFGHMESYREEPEEDEQETALPPSAVDIIEVLESFAGVGQNTARAGRDVTEIPYTLTDEQRTALNSRIGPHAADIIECMAMPPALAEDETWRDVKWLNECTEERGISQDTMTRYKKLFRENKDWVIEQLNLK